VIGTVVQVLFKRSALMYLLAVTLSRQHVISGLISQSVSSTIETMMLFFSSCRIVGEPVNRFESPEQSTIPF
jgi:hypothetical protein